MATDSGGGIINKQNFSFSLKLKVTVQELQQVAPPTEGKRIFCVFEVYTYDCCHGYAVAIVMFEVQSLP